MSDINIIEQAYEAAANGNTEMTLTNALSVLAAQFYDPAMRYNSESGTYEERNDMAWSQRIILQSVANAAWKQMYDDNLDKNGKVKGVKHKLDQARKYAQQLARQDNGTEFDIEALNRAASWIERLEAEFGALEECFHTAAAVYEAAIGEAFRPYEGWRNNQQKPQAGQPMTQEKVDEIKARFARLGIDMSDNPVLELQTNGVETTDEEAAA